MGVLGNLFDLLEGVSDDLQRFWTVLGAFWAVLGPFGPFWALLGRLLGEPIRPLGRAVLETSWILILESFGRVHVENFKVF